VKVRAVVGGESEGGSDYPLFCCAGGRREGGEEEEKEEGEGEEGCVKELELRKEG